MKIVIQCAASKVPDAGTLTDDRARPVLFVARPDFAPPSETCIYARPDDPARHGQTWRDLLVDYNATGENRFGLLPAYRLYRPEVYRQLVNRYGVDNILVLSAGWGLIRADFLTPKYDITFSANADKYKKRSKKEHYNDFRMLPSDIDEDLVFFGGKDYLSLFQNLTREYRGRRFVYYKSDSPPELPGCTLIRYQTKTKTNWHYECAKGFMAGKIALG